jgi:hypothetical protein
MDVDGLDAFESAFVNRSDPGFDLGETGIVEDTLNLGDGPLGQVDPEMIMHEHWSAHGLVLEDESDSESRDGGENGDEIREEDSDAENSDEEPDIFDWDSFEVPGLSVWDSLGEAYDAEAAIGMSALSLPAKYLKI